MSRRALTVVQAVPRLESGGVERGTVEVVEALVSRGHRAVVASAGGPMVREVEAAGGEHVEMPVAAKSPATLLSVRKMRRLLRDVRADVLHARSRVPGWVCWLAWRGMSAAERPRFVTTVHGLHSVGWYSSVMMKGEVVVAVSEAARRYVLENYRVDASRVRVIHRGVDPDAFPHGFEPGAAWRAEWGRAFPGVRFGEGDRRVLTMIGRLTRLKGHHAFLDLVSRLAGEGIDVHGLIVGGEDPRRAAYARELRERVAREGLGERVTFTGHRGDIREIAAASDAVCALSSTPESFGRSALEALRLGTPVLGWDHGGVGEVLRAVWPEGAVPLGDVESLAARARGLLKGDRAVVPPTELFTKRAMLEAIVGLYEELAGGGAR